MVGVNVHKILFLTFEVECDIVIYKKVEEWFLTFETLCGKEKIMTQQEAFKDFVAQFTHFNKNNPHLIKTTLSNIFTSRSIGTKIHGDLAEIGISEFINQFMYGFKSKHVGKDLYRAKKHEEDITITNEINNVSFSISLKAYGIGNLQLSTDKKSKMFPFLSKKGDRITGKSSIQSVFSADEMSEFNNINVLPLIYDEKNKRCNILVFDFEKAMNSTVRIEVEKEGEGKGKKRIYPVYKFYDNNGGYICEVRYGDAAANALQRGLWTNTKNALVYFKSATNGWIDYSDNSLFVELLSHALVSTQKGYGPALEIFKTDIEEQKKQSLLGNN
ncbi:hypothetical protein M0R19_04075 [Candidatus Pacearchaeota archaeon]|nr:hypothetical protein [Candidatus Pacearchaeota archaeon]